MGDERVTDYEERMAPITPDEGMLREHIEQAIRDGKVCKRQQRQGIIPTHDGSSCYVCEQWEKNLLEKEDK